MSGQRNITKYMKFVNNNKLKCIQYSMKYYFAGRNLKKRRSPSGCRRGQTLGNGRRTGKSLLE